MWRMVAKGKTLELNRCIAEYVSGNWYYLLTGVKRRDKPHTLTHALDFNETVEFGMTQRVIANIYSNKHKNTYIWEIIKQA